MAYFLSSSLFAACSSSRLVSSSFFLACSGTSDLSSSFLTLLSWSSMSCRVPLVLDLMSLMACSASLRTCSASLLRFFFTLSPHALTAKDPASRAAMSRRRRIMPSVCPDPAPVHVHVRLGEVLVRLGAQGGHALAVIPRGKALVVADHVRAPDPVARHQPARQRQGGPHLHRIGEHLLVRTAGVLDPDRRVVEPDRMAAHDRQRHELVDRPVAVDDEVRAGARQLVQLGIRCIGTEDVDRLL